MLLLSKMRIAFLMGRLSDIANVDHWCKTGECLELGPRDAQDILAMLQSDDRLAGIPSLNTGARRCEVKTQRKEA